MSSPSPAPTSTRPDDEDTAFYRAALHELITLGTDLARQIHRKAAADELPPAEATVAFERVTRAVRRTVLLASRLHEAARALNRPAARRQVIRAVEDAIFREARETPDRAPALEAEFRERLDSPDFEDDLRTRPVAEIIAEIVHDLSIDRLPGARPRWRRRTPADLAALHARAAQPPPPSPPGPAPAPAPEPEPDS